MTDSNDGCAIGIDFGTSKCIVAGKHRNGQTTIGSPYSDRSIPAYFGLDSDNHLMCGSLVKRSYSLSANGFAFGIKRLLKDDCRCKTRYDMAAHRSLKGRNAKDFKAKQCLSFILKELKNDAAQALGNESITSVVITVSNAFDQEECQMVKEAAKSTDCFKQVHLVVETQAAAIAYVEENNVQRPEKNVLVLNYGGGYLEVSFFPELSKDCLAHPGKYACQTMSSAVGAGEEITQAIMDHLRDRVSKEFGGVDIEKNQALRHEFRMQSERLKKNMRSGTAVPFAFMDVKLNTDFTGSFTPDEFTKCAADLLAALEKDLQSFAGLLEHQRVESIVLTGGSSRLPLFRDKLKRVFHKAVLKETINAEEAAAIRAATVAQHILPTSEVCGKLVLFKKVDPPTLWEKSASFLRYIRSFFI